MRILTPAFTNHYLGRMLNIHPSLLPKYQGLHTHQRAIDAGDTEHGVTVHFVTAELDGGPTAIQARVPILKNDTAETLAKRVLIEEHRIYPLAVGLFADGRLSMRNGTTLLDNQPVNL
jgi:formyltetrahydrofolate-dependent phosphoribosylglycinamide formyltransferase (EC 2.1.2.2)